MDPCPIQDHDASQSAGESRAIEPPSRSYGEVSPGITSGITLEALQNAGDTGLSQAIQWLRSLYHEQPLTTVQEFVFCQCWQGRTYREVAEALDYDPIYVRSLGAQLWKSLSQKVDRRITKSNFHVVIQQLLVDRGVVVAPSFAAPPGIAPPPLVSAAPSNLLPFQANSTQARPIGSVFNAATFQGAFPGGTAQGSSQGTAATAGSANANAYIPRPPVEINCCNAILKPGALIRIKAPHQMGKTALVNHVGRFAKGQGLQTVSISLKLAEAEIFNNLERFLQWFCAIVEDQLELTSELQSFWKPIFGSNYNCTNYLRRYILSQLETPLLLILDDVDVLFQYPAVATDFLGLLRAWCEKSKQASPGDSPWHQLRLIVAHSTEVYIPLQHHQSPFNVGLSIELPEFDSAQVVAFARHFQLDWTREQVVPLLQLIGGQPELIRLTLAAVTQQGMTLEQILAQALEPESIYQDHLRRQFRRLQQYPELISQLTRIVTAEGITTVDAMQGFRLESLGLIKLWGHGVKPSCQLYRRYFATLLQNCPC